MDAAAARLPTDARSCSMPVRELLPGSSTISRWP